MIKIYGTQELKISISAEFLAKFWDWMRYHSTYELSYDGSGSAVGDESFKEEVERFFVFLDLMKD